MSVCPNKDLKYGDWSASMLGGKLDYKLPSLRALFQYELQHGEGATELFVTGFVTHFRGTWGTKGRF